MRSVSSLSSLATVLGLLATTARCDPAVLPAVADLSHSGNGCPQGTNVGLAGDFNSLTFTFHSFASDPASSANCAVHFDAVGASPGWQVGLQKIYVRGWEVLAPGSRVETYVQAFWSQNAAYTRTATAEAYNGGGGTARRADTMVIDFGGDLLWSPCSGGDGYLGLFNANFRAITTGGAFFGNGGGVVSTERFEWVWRRC